MSGGCGTPPPQQQRRQQQGESAGVASTVKMQPKEQEESAAVAKFECVKRSAVRNGYDQRASQRTGFVEISGSTGQYF